MQGVYLIHFERPYRHARHYLGYSGDVVGRLEAPLEGNGARLMQVIAQAGIAWVLARVWPAGTRSYERRKKWSGASTRHCPICCGRVTYADCAAGYVEGPTAGKRTRAKISLFRSDDTAAEG